MVSRVCLDVLRSRATRREDQLDDQPETTSRCGRDGHRSSRPSSRTPSGSALLVVLESLAPAERLAFVLHDMFAVPFEEVAAIVGRSPAATRQLASRARRRVQQADEPARAPVDREVVDAFLAASRGGDFERLLALLDPDVVVRADAAAVVDGLRGGRPGAQSVAEKFAGRARAARPAVIDGAPGLAWLQEGATKVAFAFTIEDGRITEIELLADPDVVGVGRVLLV